jgi:hypothetical protein
MIPTRYCVEINFFVGRSASFGPFFLAVLSFRTSRILNAVLTNCFSVNPCLVAEPSCNKILEAVPKGKSLQAANDAGFLDFKQLCERLPLGERTLREAIKRRLIPHVRLPGARRLLFDWDNVRAALLRYQQGGPDNL